MRLNRQEVLKTGLMAAAAIVLLAGALIFAQAARSGDLPGLLGHSAQLADFDQNGVRVTIRLDADPALGARLTGVFTPDQPEFHLYSKDLPRGGLQGVGRPTLLEIAAPGAFRADGPLTADQPEVAHYDEVLKMAFPVYPAGAVSLHLPVERTASGAGQTVVLSVTYMACKNGACLPPVIDRRVQVTLPQD